MPDNVVEIKIIGSGIAETGAQFVGFSNDASNALKGIGASAGAASGLVDQFGRSVSTASLAAEAAKAPIVDLEAGIQRLVIAQTMLEQATANTVPALQAQTAALHGNVSEIQATSGALRVLEGSGGIRAAERFIATTLGIGGALQTIFPIVGAIAFAEVLFRMGENVGKMMGLWGGVSDAEKKAADEAAALDREIKQIGDHIKQLDDKKFEQLFGTAAAKAHEAFDVTKSQEALQAQGAIVMLQGQSADLAAKIKQDLAKGVTMEQAGSATSNYSDSLKAKIRDYHQLQEAILKYQMFLESVQKASANLAGQSLQQSGNDYTTAQNDRLAEQARAAAEAKRIDEQRVRENAEMRKAAARDAKLEFDEEQKARIEALQQENKNWEEEYQLQEAWERKIAEGKRRAAEEEKRAADESRKIARADIELESAGKVGGLENQRTGIETQKSQTKSPVAEFAYLQQIREIDRQIIQEKIQTQAKLIQLDSLNDPAKAAEDTKKLAEIQAAGQKTMAKDTEAIYKEVKQTVDSVVSEIGNDITKNVNKWITGQESFGKAMQGVWKDLATSAIQSIEKIIEKQLEQMAIQAAMKALGLDTDNGGKTGAQKQTATNVGEAQSYAGLAAGIAFADTLATSGGDIPAAVEAAGIAYAIGTAFAGAAAVSAAGGADLPNHNTLGFLHPREMVLPQSQADVIRGLASGGGNNNSRNSSSSVNVGQVNYHGAQMTEKHFGSMVKRMQRNSNN